MFGQSLAKGYHAEHYNSHNYRFIITVHYYLPNNKNNIERKHTDGDSNGIQLKELPPLSSPILSSLTNTEDEKIQHQPNAGE